MATVDPRELAYFESVAHTWRESAGPFSILSRFTDHRINFIRECLKANNTTLKGMRILDIGCGGGYVSERLAKLDAEVLAADVSRSTIQENLKELENQPELRKNLQYMVGDIEEVQKSQKAPWWKPWEQAKQFDMVICSEVIEHVNKPKLFLSKVDELVKPNGLLFISTPQRSWSSRFVFITIGEQICRFIDRVSTAHANAHGSQGCHDWKKFIRFEELAESLGVKSLGRSTCSPGTNPMDKEDVIIKGRYKLKRWAGIMYLPSLSGLRITPVAYRNLQYMAMFQKDP